MSKHNVNTIRNYLKDRIINNNVIFDNYPKEKQQIYNMLKLTVTNGESNSALIIGPRGVGKTTLLRDVLKDLRNTISLDSNAIVIELHGLIHTDDKLALRSCTTQMNLESAVDGKIFGTFAENLSFLLECLRSGHRETSKSLIFVLEEFDLFCLHSNQTLLYNLLDMTHNAPVPMCVLGLTSRLDVVELFEKRVKSRFSHRQIYLFPDSVSLSSRINGIQQLLSIYGLKLGPPVIKSWNKHIAEMVNDEKFVAALTRLCDVTKCEQVLRNILVVLVSQLNENCEKLIACSFVELVTKYESDQRIHVLNSLSVLEICLLIAMKHHCEIYDNQPFNFEMILQRYDKFVNTHAGTQVVPRSVVFKAFERIKNLELVTAVNSGSSRHQAEYELYNLALHPRQIEDAFKDPKSVVPTEVRQWLKTKLT